VDSGVPEIEVPCVSLVAVPRGGVQVGEEQAMLPAGPSEQEAPSPDPLGPLCLVSMAGLWSRLCLGGAGLAFCWKGQQSLMAGPLVPRLPSCGQQRGPEGLESFWSRWIQARSSAVFVNPHGHA
jgi:hypothetical protein